MRISQVITLGHELYGAQKHVLDLATAFNDDGHDVMVMVGTTGRLTDLCSERGVPWQQIESLQRSIRPLKDYRAFAELKSAMSEFKPDVVASHSSKSGIIARLVCNKLEIPNTFTAHGWSFEDGVPPMRRKMYKTIERLVGRVSCKIITVSELGKELANENKIVPPEKLEMIYYGTDDVGSQYPKDQQSTFTMTMAAGFREQKDHETLVHALARVKDRPWQINFLGDGPLRPQIEALVNQYGMQDKVHFRGMVNNVPEYMAQTDLLVLITNWEGLPISTLEGLTFSLPVLASDVSGVREQVVDGYNGLTVGRGDVDDVERALKTILDQPEKLAEYGKNSRALYEQHFTHEAMYRDTKTLYQSIIDSHRATGSIVPPPHQKRGSRKRSASAA